MTDPNCGMCNNQTRCPGRGIFEHCGVHNNKHGFRLGMEVEVRRGKLEYPRGDGNSRTAFTPWMTGVIDTLDAHSHHLARVTVTNANQDVDSIVGVIVGNLDRDTLRHMIMVIEEEPTVEDLLPSLVTRDATNTREA